MVGGTSAASFTVWTNNTFLMWNQFFLAAFETFGPLGNQSVFNFKANQ